MQGILHKSTKHLSGGKIVALTPIWRADIQDEKQIGEPLSYIAQYIKKVSEHVSDMMVIDCMDFVPHNPQHSLYPFWIFHTFRKGIPWI